MVVLSIHLHILLPPTVERSECHEITDVRDLTHALRNISDWKTLGYELGVPEVIIESIEIDERGAENKPQKQNVLIMVKTQIQGIRCS